MTASVATVKDIEYYEKEETKQAKSKKGRKDIENYYDEAEATIGRFRGRGAEQLGFAGDIKKGDFVGLMAGIHPGTKEQMWKDKKVSWKGTDVTLSAPKDVSILYALSNEELQKQILEVHNRAVERACLLQESVAVRRTYVNKKNIYHKDINVIQSVFNHETARPVDNQRPDMQIHSHTIMNRYAVNKEGEVYSVDNHCLFQNQKLIGTVYRAELGNGMRELGFGITTVKEDFYDEELEIDFTKEKVKKSMEKMKLDEDGYRDYLIYKAKTKIQSFQIIGIPKELRRNFSRRSEQIEKIAKEVGATTALDRQNITTSSKRSKVVWDKDELAKVWKDEAKAFGFTEEKIDTLRINKEKHILDGAKIESYILKSALTKGGKLFEGPLKLKLAEYEQYTGINYEKYFNSLVESGKIERVSGFLFKCNIDLTNADNDQYAYNLKKKHSPKASMKNLSTLRRQVGNQLGLLK